MVTSQEHTPSQDRRSALQRLSTPAAVNALLPCGDVIDKGGQASHSQERRSALQRITQSSERVSLLLNGAANSESGRLQEVEIQYMEDSFPTHILQSTGQPSSSRVPVKERLTLPQESPIRSLSEDRKVVADALASPLSSDANDPLPTRYQEQTPEPPIK